MMPVALLVLAFREPKVLQSAIPIYKAAGFDIFVHLDIKADFTQYSIALGEAAHHCHFIERRHNIYWAGFSMIDAEIALVSAAFGNEKYERFCLISDDTFPLIKPNQLNSYFGHDLDRISIRKLDHDDPFMRRYSGFFFFDHPASSLLGRPIESAAIDDDFLEEMRRLKEAKKGGKKPIDIYYGSQWWLITRGSMARALKELRDDRHLLESFRYCAVPDEMLFQTIIGNFIPRSHVRTGPVFVEWSRHPKPYVFKTVDDLPAVGPDYAFARKFTGR